MEQEIRRFRAVSDDGDEFVVIEYQRIHESRFLDGGRSIARGRRGRLALSDGSAVHQIDPETFKIVEADQIIRKVN